MSEKILVVLLHGIGDSLMAAPALRALKKKFPGASLTLMTIRKPLFRSLWKYNNDVDRVMYSSLPYNPRYGHPLFWLRDFWRIRLDIRRAVRKEGFTRVYFVKMFLMPAKMYALLGWKRYREHKTLRVARELGVKVLDQQYHITYGDEERTWVGTFLQRSKISGEKLVGLHFAGSTRNKSLPHNLGMEIVKMLRSLGYQPILFHSASSYQRERVHYPTEDVVTYISDDVLHSAALVDTCQFLICVDSGVSHLAAALGKNVFTLYFREIWAQNSLAKGKGVVPFVYRDNKDELLERVHAFIRDQ